MKKSILAMVLVCSSNLYAATFSCDVISCTDVMANCPTNIYVLESSDRIVFNFHSSQSPEEPQTIAYANLSFNLNDDTLSLTDESDSLFVGQKEAGAKTYIGQFDTFETLSSAENMPVVSAKVRCSRVN